MDRPTHWIRTSTGPTLVQSIVFPGIELQKNDILKLLKLALDVCM